MKYSFLIGFIFIGASLAGQYTYFNVVHGEMGDDFSEVASNIEVFEDHYVTWGGVVYAGQPFPSIRSYSYDGELLASLDLSFTQSYLYVGLTNSFQRIPGEDAFLMSHAIVDAEGTHGFLMKVDSNLDTLWTRKIDIFPPYTYFFTHAWDEDGFILAGEYGLGPGVRGTFIAKVDLDGNYLWHEILHEPSEGAFRNFDISTVNNQIFVSGAFGAGFDTDGYTEVISDSGILEHSLFWEEPSFLRGGMRHFVHSNGNIVMSQSVEYEDYDNDQSNFVYYNQLNLYSFNEQLDSLVVLASLFTDYQWISSGIINWVEGSNDGIVGVGGGRFEENGTLVSKGLVLKINDEFDLEWITELAYNPCASCSNILYDIEQAPDGGYVMVGKFNDQINDPYDKTWLVKVDACGDLVWQGCEPVGLGSSEFEVLGAGVLVYPNPATDILSVRGPNRYGGRGQRCESLQVIDVTGKVVKEMSNSELRMLNDEVEIDVSTLPQGLYSILLTTDESESFTGKFIKE